MFICKANRLSDGTEIVDCGFLPKWNNSNNVIIGEQGYTEIDPLTLTISFDGGASWYDDLQLVSETLEAHYPKGI